MRYDLRRLVRAMRLSDDAARLALGVSGKQWRRYHEVGLSYETAERLAIRAGFHIYVIWPEALQDYNDQLNQRIRRQRREAQARWRAKNPEPSREARRRYYAANADYERERERRRYWENRDAILARKRERRRSA